MNAAYKSLSVRISKCSGIDDTAEAYMSESFFASASLSF